VSGDESLLRLRRVSRSRGREPDAFHLEIPSFELRRRSCVALTGPSGSGKSTVLDLLGLVLKPDHAETFALDAGGSEVDVAALWRSGDDRTLAAVRSRLIGYVLQTGGLLPFLNASDNVRLSPWLLGSSPDEGWIARLIDVLALGALMRRRPSALSIGERQRVAIARALAHRPALLLADEPTAALDPGQGRRVMEMLLELVREAGVSIVVVTHDWELVRTLGLAEVRAQHAGDSAGAMRFVC